MVCTQYGKTKSLAINKGVKQGDLLSLLLWNLFINPVVEHLLTANLAHSTKFSEKVRSTAFADDIVLLASTVEKMMEAFEAFHDFCAYHQLCINVGKSTVIATKGNTLELMVQTDAGPMAIPHTQPTESV
jgi:hypothetical protein